MLRSIAGSLGSPLFVFLFMLACLSSSPVSAQQSVPRNGLDLPPLPNAVPTSEPLTAKPPTIEELVRQIIVEAVSDEYVDDKKWGHTTRRFDGFKTKGLKISKRTKRVNHGLWQRYRAKLIKPKDTLRLAINQLDHSTSKSDKTRFSIELIARARCEGTLENWVYGVKGLNGTTVADTTIRIRILLSIDPQASFSFSDPLNTSLHLNPTVESVSLALKDIDVRQIGVFRGPGVELMGDASRKAIEELMEQQEKKIRVKLQKKLDEL